MAAILSRPQCVKVRALSYTDSNIVNIIVADFNVSYEKCSAKRVNLEKKNLPLNYMFTVSL